jgi:hypothetical protein
MSAGTNNYESPQAESLRLIERLITIDWRNNFLLAHFWKFYSPMRKKSTPKKWSASVTKHSHALALESSVFTKDSPKKIAQSLKRSAEQSKSRKAGPFQSAMSMLNFYVNRGGKNLSASKKEKLEKAKGELRKLFHKE